jgi:hypothetical protein
VYAVNPRGLPSDAEIAAWLRLRPERLRRQAERTLDEPTEREAHENWLDSRLSSAINRLLRLAASGDLPARKSLAELRLLSSLPFDERVLRMRDWRAQNPALFEELLVAERQAHETTEPLKLGGLLIPLGTRKRQLRVANELGFELERSGFATAEEAAQAAKVRRWRWQWRRELEGARPPGHAPREPDPRPGAAKRGRLPL